MKNLISALVLATSFAAFAQAPVTPAAAPAPSKHDEKKADKADKKASKADAKASKADAKAAPATPAAPAAPAK